MCAMYSGSLLPRNRWTAESMSSIHFDNTLVGARHDGVRLCLRKPGNAIAFGHTIGK